jgi:hypothetical protein
MPDGLSELTSQLVLARRQIAELKAVLSQVEWVQTDDFHLVGCPWCGETYRYGARTQPRRHLADCPRERVLNGD